MNCSALKAGILKLTSFHVLSNTFTCSERLFVYFLQCTYCQNVTQYTLVSIKFSAVRSPSIHIFKCFLSCISVHTRWQVSATNWHLPTTSTRVKSCAAAAADFQIPPKGVQGGEQTWGTLSLGITDRRVLQIVRYFQEPILLP